MRPGFHRRAGYWSGTYVEIVVLEFPKRVWDRSLSLFPSRQSPVSFSNEPMELGIGPVGNRGWDRSAKVRALVEVKGFKVWKVGLVPNDSHD
ncbi:hypothetical protein TIFTF001_033367 [Ficus carica]|uniref:Uncharacterized protein n=1 Tax=Ficus carica TaxID=3494 RepID=A0AA88J717_FICCA|nr:hypothetical protein TIFTF001_033367 [Ficus carica]